MNVRETLFIITNLHEAIINSMHLKANTCVRFNSYTFRIFSLEIELLQGNEANGVRTQKLILFKCL